MISLLNSYIAFMNQSQSIPGGTLEFDFEFLSNEMEAQYEGIDFFKYHWPHNQKVLDGINRHFHEDVFVYDGHGASSFVVASIGSSSTQTYFVNRAGQIESKFYEFGTGNFKSSVFETLTEDLLESKRNVVFMNSVGFGVQEDSPGLVLPSKNTSNDRKAAQVIDALSSHAPDPERILWIVMNSRMKPKLKNDWTNAFILNRHIPEDENIFFVDYGGGSISIQHALGQQMDENAIAKLKYDQDSIIDFYKNRPSLESKEQIAPQLIENRQNIIRAIKDYIEQHHLTQASFPVIIRQTGKLRELYRQISAQYTVNPETNRSIKIGGATHKRLLRKYRF